VYGLAVDVMRYVMEIQALIWARHVRCVMPKYRISMAKKFDAYVRNEVEVDARNKIEAILKAEEHESWHDKFDGVTIENLSEDYTYVDLWINGVKQSKTLTEILTDEATSPPKSYRELHQEVAKSVDKNDTKRLEHVNDVDLHTRKYEGCYEVHHRDCYCCEC